MKLVIAGATGFVATECVRRSLVDPRFTTVVALARREVQPPTDLGPKADVSKLQSVVVQDYGTYSDEVRQKLAGTDACIWTVAITPNKTRQYTSEEVKRVCRDNALDGFQTLIDARGDTHGNTPLRFIYMSGTAAERDQTKSPLLLKEMCLMRGEAETAVLALAAKYPGTVEACCAKPGIIYRDNSWIFSATRWIPAPVPRIPLGEVASAMLDQVYKGFEKEPLQNDDLARIGGALLTAEANL